MDRKGIFLCGCVALAAFGCARETGPKGLAVQDGPESLCVQYANEQDANLKAQIAAKQDAATMAAIDRREAEPGLPALVAYCVHGAPIERHRAPTSEGEIERVTFCREAIETGERCETTGPTLVIAQDRIAASPTPTQG